MKNLVTISLGGSVIIPDKVNYHALLEFKRVLIKNKKYKFIVVCGGGKPARIYINGLSEEKIKEKKKIYFQTLLGVSVTRLNARFMTYFFGKDANQGIPNSIKELENYIKVNNFVFCGALRQGKKETSDSTAAKIANHFNTMLINITNVAGLYDKDPNRFIKPNFIHEISYKNFLKMANKIAYKPGQHFILDQKAAKIIKKNKITTYILGKNMKNFDNFLNNKHFIGTLIN